MYFNLDEPARYILKNEAVYFHSLGPTAWLTEFMAYLIAE
jgi:hypothetical protein